MVDHQRTALVGGRPCGTHVCMLVCGTIRLSNGDAPANEPTLVRATVAGDLVVPAHNNGSATSCERAKPAERTSCWSVVNSHRYGYALPPLDGLRYDRCSSTQSVSLSVSKQGRGCLSNVKASFSFKRNPLHKLTFQAVVTLKHSFEILCRRFAFYFTHNLVQNICKNVL